jgi:predicted transcriptional regulator of viral defense system
MKLLEFLDRFKKEPAFSVQQVEQVYPGFERESLLNWQKKGYIVRIRNGWYSVAGRIATEEHLYWVANKIYRPSYVSLETAHAYYGWIPEAVFTVTSVSTRKTQVFDTTIGHFRYSSVKPSLFFGYRLLKTEGYGIKIAEPEKALLDFLYLYPKIATTADFEALRFNLDQMRNEINQEKLSAYCTLFDSVALSKRLQIFKNHLYHAESV